ncbi:hypothetical protein JD844_025736 [Phrynosoma platyrhinos]|uniref:Squalene synthase n=1 Tax=Phrynosoma platyrhinos TaxID=52577 RepID=A0ABQ7SZJ8_PHRPL|nr:hypothetical protein JD844_025736 [Phrynosoma platyrhinos]
MELLKKWLGHPEELYNLVRFKMGGYKTVMPKMDQTTINASSLTPVVYLQDSLSDSLRVCYQYLKQTSRSYAAVIQVLDGELRHVACIFYLIIRALDTVEDDMTINLETKISMLQNFHSYLYQPDWRFMDSNEKHKQVLEDFPTISLEFRKLGKNYRDVIADICHRMGLGMAEFLEKNVESKKEWDKKKPHGVGELCVLANNRVFQLGRREELRESNQYLASNIVTVMATATLLACYNNQQVFRGVVKIRKGQAVTLMMDATNIQAVKAIMYKHMEEFYQKIPSTDPSSRRTQQIITCIRSMTSPGEALVSQTHYSPIYLSCLMLLTALSWHYLSMVSKADEEYMQTGEN